MHLNYYEILNQEEYSHHQQHPLNVHFAKLYLDARHIVDTISVGYGGNNSYSGTNLFKL